MMPGNDVAESFQHAAMIFPPALAVSRRTVSGCLTLQRVNAHRATKWAKL